MLLPYLLSDFPGIGGVIKQRPEDFFVQEIPLYEPTGQGEHVYAEIQKIGLTTFDAVHRIADALHISPRDIGYAGMKDAHAVSRQMLSIWGTTEQAVQSLHIPNLTVLSAIRHNNKLRLGHLAANRFAIKIRDVNPTDVVKVRDALKVLEQRGLPNYFGQQRFGRRNNNHLLGFALVRGDYPALLSDLLGKPDPKIDDPQSIEARQAFDAHDYEKAMKLFPRRSGMERRILARFIKTKKEVAAARAIDQKLRRLWVSAAQSKIFNDVVAARIQSLDRLLDGDLAWKHDNGSVFRVQSAPAEQARCDAFEISPTGPLIGYRMTLPEKEPLQIEQQIFAAHSLRPEDFRQEGKEKVKGARRPLRVQPKEVNLAGGADEFGPHITVAFTLPPGAFATVLLRELMKTDSSEDAGLEQTRG
jgi:tRNA pseudouridine13 synthase